jgi:hypothetical protein
MHNLKWSESEKKLSRRLFEAALEAELAEIMAEFFVLTTDLTSSVRALRTRSSRAGPRRGPFVALARWLRCFSSRA